MLKPVSTWNSFRNRNRNTIVPRTIRHVKKIVWRLLGKVPSFMNDSLEDGFKKQTNKHVASIITTTL